MFQFHTFLAISQLKLQQILTFPTFQVCWYTSAWKANNRHSFTLFSPLHIEIATNSDFSIFPVCCCTTACKVYNRCRSFALFYPLQNWNCNKFYHFPLFGSFGAQGHEKLLSVTVLHYSLIANWNCNQFWLCQLCCVLLLSRMKSW